MTVAVNAGLRGGGGRGLSHSKLQMRVTHKKEKIIQLIKFN